LTPEKIAKGDFLPCSRNPVLGQYLNHLRLMEQRGSGIGRMRSAMLNHGLSAPKYDLLEGYFRVILMGPGDDLDCLRSPQGIGSGIPPAVEDQLNDRQKRILVHVAESGAVTSGWCRKEFGVTYNTAYRDLSALTELKLLAQTGKGRSTRYILSVEGR
jgi:ATP-dependent DNA helicase RecG